VLHLRDSHFFTVDISMVFFCVATWAAAVAMADQGRPSAYIAAGVGLGAAVACKYNAVFLVPLIVAAHVCSRWTPLSLYPMAAWCRWTLKGVAPLLVGATVFLLLDPMVLLFYEKFRGDVSDQISGPLLGASRPLWNANFRDIQPQLYWFSNLLPWGIGPAFAIWGIAGVAWLLPSPPIRLRTMRSRARPSRRSSATRCR
jgi:4-amino-4-deoxy-L-arabinose transferase-like glycosyltransferase